jgi:phosphoribosylformimino-5-aminoimidazole carboxamide ribotide isomerase
MRLIPAIDLRDGRCVRLYQGRFDAETVYTDQPASVLARYRALGARYVHVVDLDGARAGAPHNRTAIEALVRGGDGSVDVQVGGGVRSREIVEQWLGLGVRRVVVGSVAVARPEEVLAWLDEFGADRVVLAFDVRIDADGAPRLATHGWETQSQTSLWSAAERFSTHGARHVLCTDVARDGALSGPNLELYAEATRRFPALQWQASGGIATGADLRSLAATGVAAVISGRALLEDRIPAEELAPFLPSA